MARLEIVVGVVLALIGLTLIVVGNEYDVRITCESGKYLRDIHESYVCRPYRVFESHNMVMTGCCLFLGGLLLEISGRFSVRGSPMPTAKIVPKPASKVARAAEAYADATHWR